MVDLKSKINQLKKTEAKERQDSKSILQPAPAPAATAEADSTNSISSVDELLDKVGTPQRPARPETKQSREVSKPIASLEGALV